MLDNNPPTKKDKLWGLCYYLFCLLTLIAVTSYEIKSSLIERKIYKLRKQVINSPCIPLPENDGLLIHIDCPIKSNHHFSLPKEFYPNLKNYSGVFLETKVEMYQSPINSKHAGEWKPYVIENNANVDYMPFISGVGRQFAPKIVAGSFLIEAKAAATFKKKYQIPLTDDGIYEKSNIKPPMQLSSKNTQVFNNSLYSGDPFDPELGDVRIKFYGSNSTHISVIGRQSNKTLLEELGIIEPRRTIYLDTNSELFQDIIISAEGDHSAEKLLKIYEYKVNPYLPWLNAIRTINIILLTSIIYSIIMSYKQVLVNSRLPKVLVLMISVILTVSIELLSLSMIAIIYSYKSSIIYFTSSLLTFLSFMALYKQLFPLVQDSLIKLSSDKNIDSLTSHLSYTTERYAAL